MNTLFQWGGHPLVYRLGWTLLHFLWQGAAVAGLFAVAQAWLSRRSSNARYWTGCLALLLMLAAPVITFFALGTEREVPAAPAGDGARLDPPALVRTDEGLGLGGPGGQGGQHGQTRASFAPARNPNPNLNPNPSSAAPSLHPEKFIPGFVLAWLLGVSALSLRLLFSSLQVARLKRRGHEALGAPWVERLDRLKAALQISRPVRLVKCVLVEVPAVVGWLRPVILLPAATLAGLTPAQLESILAHELAHIRRHDYLVNLLQNALETLLFYHPAVWWVSSCVRAEREICCDEIAIRVCGDRLIYAQALTALEQLRAGGPSLALGAGGGSLLERIRRLSGAPDGGSFPARRRAGGALAAALVAVIFVSLLHHPSSDAKARTNDMAAKERKERKEIAPGTTNQTNATSGAVNSSKPSANGEKMDDVIAFDDLPLPDAIRRLATLAKLDIQFDHSLDKAADPVTHVPVPYPRVSEKWHDLTPLQALQALLDKYGWQMKRSPSTPVVIISAKDANTVEPQVIKVILLGASEPTNIVAEVKAALGDRIAIFPDNRNYKVIVRTTEREMPAVEALIKQFDTATNPVPSNPTPSATKETNDAAGTANSSKPAANPSGISLEIRGPTNIVKVGDEIPIEFIISNHGTEDYKYVDRNHDWSGRMPEYSLSAKTTSGESVPDPHLDGAGMLSIAGGAGEFRVVHPGESFTKVIALNLWVLMKEPGRYEVAGNYLGETYTDLHSRRPRADPISSDPITVTLLPRTQEEMHDYVKGLSNQVAERLAAHDTAAFDGVLEGLLVKLEYTCSPEIIPTLVKTLDAESAGARNEGHRVSEALVCYVPHTEETRKTLMEAVARHDLYGYANSRLQPALRGYDFNNEAAQTVEKSARQPAGNTKTGDTPPSATNQTNTASAAVNSSKPAENPSGISLEIRGPTNVLKVGDEIPIEFIISNHGIGDFQYLDPMPEPMAMFVNEINLAAQTASGESVPKPHLHERAMRFLRQLKILRPGESFSKIIPLNLWALIKTAGSYRVTGTFLGAKYGGDLIAPLNSAPLSITVLPRTKEEMDGYIQGLSNQVEALLAAKAARMPKDDLALDGLLMKLMYTCSPKIVPTLLRLMEETGNISGNWHWWGEEALSLYVPKTEETWQTILQAASRHGLNHNLESLLVEYDFNPAEMRPIIEGALAADKVAEWRFGAMLAADSYYEDAFTSRLIAIALDSNAPPNYTGHILGQELSWNTTRGPALKALAYNRTDAGVKALKSLLDDPDPQICVLLAQAIQGGYNRQGKTPTGRHLQSEDFDAKDVRPLIERLLASVYSSYQWQGLLLAELFGDDALTPKLVALATNSEYMVRPAAINALAMNRTEEGMKTLKMLLNDPNPKISKMAEDAIRHAYTARGDARGRPLRADDFDVKFQQPEGTPAK